MNYYYKCSECGKTYPITPDRMLCEDCSSKQKSGRPLRGILEVAMEGQLADCTSVYAVLPIEKKWFPQIPVGNTPLWSPKKLQQKHGFPNLFIKDDTRNLTGSYKDRASWLVAASALKWGIRHVTVASTGNAASSMAGIGAAAGLKVTIYVPGSIPKAKLVQSLQYGAEVISVNGNYDDAFRMAMKPDSSEKVLNRNTGYNPLTLEGKKTASFELCHQMTNTPDYIFVPAGDAVVLSGMIKGFKDLQKLGKIGRFPKFIAVQAEGSSALAKAMEQGDFSDPVKSETIADSIQVDVPACGYYALRELKAHSGDCITVSDNEIRQAQIELSSEAGLFAEPSAAASLAGLLKMKADIEPEAKIVLLASGTGLKDIDNAQQAVENAGRTITRKEVSDD